MLALRKDSKKLNLLLVIIHIAGKAATARCSLVKSCIIDFLVTNENVSNIRQKDLIMTRQEVAYVWLKRL